MTTDDQPDQVPPDRVVPDPDEPRDTDQVIERTEAPQDGETFDEDAPGNYVDDRESPEVPEPNEPA